MRPLITKLTLALIAALWLGAAKAQSPELISYQAVARDASTGVELVNQSIYIVLKVRTGSANGDIVYQEDYVDIETNKFGLFNIAIGGGNPIAGEFGQIDWGRSMHWLEIDMDAGEGIETLGAMQFISVPYALHAKTVENKDDADADPTNEFIDSLTLGEDNILVISQGANVQSVSLASVINSDDIDPTNELIDSLSLSGDYTLTVGEGDNIQTVDLGGMVNFDDVDPTNELIDSLSLSGDYTLTVGEGDNIQTVDLGGMVNFDDVDPTNELIDSLSLSGDYTLTVGEGDNIQTVDLGGMVNFDDVDPTNELIDSLSLSGDYMLTVGEGDNIQTVDLGGMVNFDDVDPTNELIEEIVLREDFVLSLIEGGITFNVDLSGMVDTQDTLATNELQTLAEVIAFSTPTGSAGNQRITELAAPVSASDAATKAYVDGLVAAGDVTGDLGNSTVVAIQNTPVSSTSPTDRQVMIYNGATSQWEPTTPPPAVQFFSVDIADFVGGSESGDGDNPNRVIYDDNPNFVTVDRDDRSNMLYAPLHLPHGVPITEFTVFYRKFFFTYNFEARLIRQVLSTGNRQVIAEMSTLGMFSGAVQNVSGSVSILNDRNIVDNSQYTYRIEAEFDIPDDQDSATGSFIQLMGAVIKLN